MPFTLKGNPDKGTSIYKTIYIPESLKDRIEDLACSSNSSFSKVVIEMIEYSLANMEEPQG